MPLMINIHITILLLLGLTGISQAREDLTYPEGPLTAEQVVRQVYIGARGGLVSNAVSQRNKGAVALVINRAPLEKRVPGRMPTISTFETYVNNRPTDSAIKSKQMAILTSGKTKGTGVLLTNYIDQERGATISMWLPALRKIRRINEPSHEDVWFGTTLTYGELVLRKTEDEIHELLGEGVFEHCLGVMELETWEKNRYTKKLPGQQCGHKGKPIYRLKSTTKFKNWWYDYHISDIDKESFSLYRSVYFKAGEKIKTVDVDWQSLDQPDPRISYPRYIYALMHDSGKDSMVYVPRSTIQLNVDLPDSFWSEETMKRRTR
ncbi:MAG: outer membrane lipoprotein-sorting protein [Pseudomonadota bacterium]